MVMLDFMHLVKHMLSAGTAFILKRGYIMTELMFNLPDEVNPEP